MRPCVFLPTHAALPIRLTISKRTFRRSVLLDTSHLVFFHHAARWMGLGLGTTSWGNEEHTCESLWGFCSNHPGKVPTKRGA